MNGAFFSDLLTTIADRGRNLLGLPPGDAAARRSGGVADLCEALLSGRGEASGTALAREVLESYARLDEAGRLAFFVALAERFGPDPHALGKAVETWSKEPSEERAAAVHYASEPRRQVVFRRLNRAPGGTAALVRMREDLLRLLPENPALKVVDRDFVHLLNSWFNRGFLVLRRIDWSSPAAILDKIIAYEAVHEIKGWDDLRRRLDPADRRCFAFFHPSLVDEPLIFVEVALMDETPDAIEDVLAEARKAEAAASPTTAVFYSISNCQDGLRGISFGNFLIKQVVEELARERPSLATFVTLSPVPGFARWLNRGLSEADASVVAPSERAALAGLGTEGWIDQPALEARLKGPLLALAARYLLTEKAEDGRPADPVARFHLGNGARLERINWRADRSPRGLREAHGVMVNYRYDPREIEANHEAYANEGKVAVGRAVRNLLTSVDRVPVTQRLPGGASDALKPAAGKPAGVPGAPRTEPTG